MNKKLLLLCTLSGLIPSCLDPEPTIDNVYFCTAEDQEAGLCLGPLEALLARTRQEIPPNGVEQQAGCTMQGVSKCHVVYTIPILDIVVHVECVKSGGQTTCTMSFP